MTLAAQARLFSGTTLRLTSADTPAKIVRPPLTYQVEYPDANQFKTVFVKRKLDHYERINKTFNMMGSDDQSMVTEKPTKMLKDRDHLIERPRFRTFTAKKAPEQPPHNFLKPCKSKDKEFLVE